MIAQTHQSIQYYTFKMWPDLTHGVFTRKGGVSQQPFDSLNVGGTVGDDLDAVHINHERMYDALQLNRAKACTAWLVHGNDVVVVDGAVEGRKWIAKADAMITDKLDIPLVMRYADCTPIMFYDPTKQVIGIAHAGWRGTVAGVASATVRAMQDSYSCTPLDIQVGIGPAIGPECYQVGEEVVEAVRDAFGVVDDLIQRNPADGTAYFNLWEANRRDLQNAGVEQIEVAEICTASNLQEFYSHRAEKGRTGRFGAIISL